MPRRRTKYRHLPPWMHFKSGAYYLVKSEHGKRPWTRLGTDYAQALAEYARLTRIVITPGTYFRDLAAEYVRAEFPKLRSATRESYGLALENLLKSFGDAPVRKITPAHVGRYMDLRSSIHSANREKAVLSKILQLGVRWGWCDENVARKVAYHATTRRRTIITPAQWKEIHLAAPSNLIPVFMDLALITGLRVGDLLALRWSQVTVEGMHVLQGKNSVEGVYVRTESLESVLERARRLHGDAVALVRPDTAIIHTRLLQPYSYAGIRSAWRRVLVQAGCEGLRIHDIRRTAITRAKQEGRRPQEFSLHRTEREAAAYVVDVPRVRPLELMHDKL